MHMRDAALASFRTLCHHFSAIVLLPLAVLSTVRGPRCMGSKISCRTHWQLHRAGLRESLLSSNNLGLPCSARTCRGGGTDHSCIQTTCKCTGDAHDELRGQCPLLKESYAASSQGSAPIRAVEQPHARLQTQEACMLRPGAQSELRVTVRQMRFCAALAAWTCTEVGNHLHEHEHTMPAMLLMSSVICYWACWALGGWCRCAGHARGCLALQSKKQLLMGHASTQKAFTGFLVHFHPAERAKCWA